LDLSTQESDEVCILNATIAPDWRQLFRARWVKQEGAFFKRPESPAFERSQ